MRTPLALALVFASALVRASDFCGAGCFGTGYVFVWPECPEDVGFYECVLSIPQRTETLALCCATYCKNPEKAWKQGIHDIASYYLPVNKFRGKFQETLANATQYMVDAPTNLTQVNYAPFIPPEELFQEYYKAETDWGITEKDMPQAFAWVFLMFTLVVVVGAAARYAWLAFRSKQSVDARQPKARALGIYTKKYLLMPAIFHSTTHRPSVFGFTFSLPTRLQSVLVFLLVMINAIACGWNLRTGVNAYWETKWISAVRYVADRTGMFAWVLDYKRCCMDRSNWVSVYNMPVMFAFAGRNNILIWLTGSSFDTFNVFHKWLGRIVIMQAVIHSILYTWEIVYYGGSAGLSEDYLEPYLRWGAVATVAGGLIFGQAVHVARKYWYETFLVIHIVMAILFTVGTWYHIKLLGYSVVPEWNAYLSWMIAACVIWLLDRFTRVVRLLIFNVNRKDGQWQVTKGVVKEPSPGLYTISIRMARDWNFVAGQYCFLYFGKRHHFLQSHPFTIMSYEDEDVSATDSPRADEKGSLNGSSSRASGRPSKVLTLLVRQHKGVTKQLSGLAHGEPSTMLVEGPYGHGLPLQNYDNVTLVAGGVGVTGIMPHVRRATTQAHKLVHFVWSVRKLEEAEGLHAWLDKAQHPSLKISIYVSQADQSKDKKEDSVTLLAIQNLTIYNRRANIDEVLAGDSTHAGSWAVVGCGPGRQLDDTRAACVGLLNKKPEPIDFFSEGFEW